MLSILASMAKTFSRMPTSLGPQWKYSLVSTGKWFPCRPQVIFAIFLTVSNSASIAPKSTSTAPPSASSLSFNVFTSASALIKSLIHISLSWSFFKRSLSILWISMIAIFCPSLKQSLTSSYSRNGLCSKIVFIWLRKKFSVSFRSLSLVFNIIFAPSSFPFAFSSNCCIFAWLLFLDTFTSSVVDGRITLVPTFLSHSSR